MGTKVKRPRTREAYWLTTLEEAREIIGYDDPTESKTQDSLIQKLIARCSSLISLRCSRNFRYLVYDIMYDMEPQRTRLWIDNPPIGTSPVLQIWDDPAREWGDDRLLTVDVDYIIYYEEGKIRLRSGWFSYGAQVIRVMHRGGYNTIPEGLKAACEFWVAELFQLPSNKRHQLLSESHERFSTSFAREAVPVHVVEMIEPWILEKGAW